MRGSERFLVLSMRYLFAVYFLLSLSLSSLAFEFDAKVIQVIDGDTFKFETTVLNVTIRDTCRALRYNAPELQGKERPEGLKAKRYLFNIIQGKKVRIKAASKDKYGRWLCEVWKDGESINDKMKEYLKDYKGRDKYNYLHKR